MAPEHIHLHGLKPDEANFLNWVHPEVEKLIARYAATEPSRKAELEKAARNFGVAYIEEAEKRLPADKVYVVTLDASGEPFKIEKKNRADVHCHCSKWDLTMHCVQMTCP